MKLGQVDIATVSSGNVGAFGTIFDIINLPYIFKDAETANKITTAWLGKELSQRAEAALAPVPWTRSRRCRAPAATERGGSAQQSGPPCPPQAR
jgi:hypothetical protein